MDAPKFAAYGYDRGLGTYESPEPHPDITAKNWIWSLDDKVKRWDRTKWMVDQTLEFLKANPDKPCFVNLWLDDTHTPWVPSAEDQTTNKKGGAAGKGDTKERLAKVLVEMDRQLGRLLDAIRESKRPTLVLFLGDNGPLPTFVQSRTAGLRGSKLSLYEGGIRVPFIAWGPGIVKPGVTNSDTVFSARRSLPEPLQAVRRAAAERLRTRRRGPERGSPGRGLAEANTAAVLGVRPQRHLLRLPEGWRQQEPEPGGARRRLETARQQYRRQGRALRPRRRSERDGRRRCGEPRGDEAPDRHGSEVAEVATVTTSKTLLFVYGTLKRGLGNHRLIADQEYLGEVMTEPRYRVIDLGPYPGLIVDRALGLAVKGEMWSVSAGCLAALDEFEEVAGPFIRAAVAISGREDVDAYFWNRPVPADVKSGDRWPLNGAD